MSPLPAAAYARLRSQHGLITARQLQELGVSRQRRAAVVGSGEFERIHADILRHAGAEPTLAQAALAVCLAAPCAVVSGPTAGRLLGLRRMPHGPVHVMTTGSVLRIEGIVLHRTNQLTARDVVSLPNGLRHLHPLRLAFDLARFLDDHDFESVLEQMIDRRLLTVPAAFATGRRLRISGRDGSTRFSRVLESRPAWTKPPESHDEVTLLRALRVHGIDLTTQLPVELPNGTTIHLDGGDEGVRFGVEVDHVTWHGGRVDVQYDKWRSRQLVRLGWSVPRVTDTDVQRHLGSTVADLVHIYRECAARVAR